MKKIITLAVILQGLIGTAHALSPSTNPPDWYEGTYVAPDESAIPNDATGDMIRYGKLLLSETYKYLGGGAGLSYSGNKISCTNCHLDNGTSAYGTPWAVVWWKYGNGGTDKGPYSARSNRYLDMKNRIHDCTVRSMNGFQLPDDSYELLSMIEYMKWLATGMKVTPYTSVKGQANISVTALTRAADPVRGKTVYEDNCASCHGYTGEGVWNEAAQKYVYPAVWGPGSFNDGAGMYRLRSSVGFIKGNMPFGWANASDPTHQLSVDDSWDAMAYVISNQRPHYSGSLNDFAGYRPSDCMPNWVLKQPDGGYEWYYPRIKPDGTLTGDQSYPNKWSPDKHKYGPWQDMIAEQTRLQNAYLAITPRPVYPNCVPFESL